MIDTGTTQLENKHRIKSSVLDRDKQARQQAKVKPITETVSRLARQASRCERPLVVPKDERRAYRRENSLRAFYMDWMYVDRMERYELGTLKRATLEKDRQTLNRFERFSRPAGFQGEWPGLPIEDVNEKTLNQLFQTALESGMSGGTVRSWWASLRAILNQAVRRRVLLECPPVRIPKTYESKDTPAKAMYTEPRIAKVYAELANEPALQVAFVISLSAGLRPIDLFLLRWSDLVLEETDKHGRVRFFDFISQKTGKHQRIPMTENTWRQVSRLPRVSDFVFDGFCCPGHVDPERGMKSRMRNNLMKRAVARALDVDPFSRRSPWGKPWQVGRLTCNERLQRHTYGLGDFVLGHQHTLNATSYREPTDLIIDGVLEVPPPEPFSLAITDEGAVVSEK